MKTGVVTVENAAPILEAAKLMRVSKVGGLPVLDKAGSLVGMCTQSDLLDHLYVIGDEWEGVGSGKREWRRGEGENECGNKFLMLIFILG